jgi:hypothetical protein
VEYELKSYSGIAFCIKKYGIHEIIYFSFDERYVNFLVTVMNQLSLLLDEDMNFYVTVYLQDASSRSVELKAQTMHILPTLC